MKMSYITILMKKQKNQHWMKHDKSQGILREWKQQETDNINAELLQAAGPQMTQRIQDLILNTVKPA